MGRGAFSDTIIGAQVGVPAGDPVDNASDLACHPNVPEGCLGLGAGLPDFDFPVLTCYENNFIIAEAQSALGDDAAARTALDNALSCVEDRWADLGGSVDLTLSKDVNDAMAGTDLFNEIMDQKYMAMFLNRTIWSDYKRTCRPAITPFDYPNQGVPGRFRYAQSERESNSNIPDAANQPLRNDNDPAACP
jgi:hypothetical protein